MFRIPVFLMVLGVAVAPAVWAQGRGSQVRGRVTDTQRQPLAGALVIAGVERPDTIITDSTGAFVFTRLRRGLHTFMVRRLGYASSTFEVEFQNDTVIDVDVPLETPVTTLTTITVRGTSNPVENKLRTVGFEERRLHAERTASDATYITPQEIQRRRPSRVSHLLEGHIGYRIEYSGLIALARGRDGCVMSIWLDGQLLQRGGQGGRSGSRTPVRTSPNPAQMPGLDEVGINDVAAVEIYPSATGTPPQFQALSGSCGAVVIWTRQ